MFVRLTKRVEKRTQEEVISCENWFLKPPALEEVLTSFAQALSVNMEPVLNNVWWFPR